MWSFLLAAIFLIVNIGGAVAQDAQEHAAERLQNVVHHLVRKLWRRPGRVVSSRSKKKKNATVQHNVLSDNKTLHHSRRVKAP